MNKPIKQPLYPLINPPSERRPKYPELNVPLPTEGPDANPHALIAEVTRFLRAWECSEDEIKAFWAEALSGTYEHVQATCEEYVNVLWDHWSLDYYK